VSKIDETLELSLKFDTQGLIPAIICDVSDNSVLMFAYMNQLAFDETRRTGIVHFWSRSRNSLWKKGETSGEPQRPKATPATQAGEAVFTASSTVVN
jgi:phosphoribosyl-AMP cyclohydrolase